MFIYSLTLLTKLNHSLHLLYLLCPVIVVPTVYETTYFPKFASVNFESDPTSTTTFSSWRRSVLMAQSTEGQMITFVFGTFPSFQTRVISDTQCERSDRKPFCDPWPCGDPVTPDSSGQCYLGVRRGHWLFKDTQIIIPRRAAVLSDQRKERTHFHVETAKLSLLLFIFSRTRWVESGSEMYCSQTSGTWEWMKWWNRDRNPRERCAEVTQTEVWIQRDSRPPVNHTGFLLFCEQHWPALHNPDK